MQPDFWHDKWERNEIGFHQQSINQYLRKHWSALALAGHETVLVPLCGKSLDLHWINALGHPVIGVELSQTACQLFFKEADLTPDVHEDGAFTVYRHGTITLLCGDWFALTAEHVAAVAAVYDRAALIAFPTPMRPAYMSHLKQVLPAAAQVLLVTMEYPQHEMQGPPFSVTEPEVSSLCAGRFHAKLVYENELGKDDPFAKRKGLSDMWEKVYVLSP